MGAKGTVVGGVVWGVVGGLVVAGAVEEEVEEEDPEERGFRVLSVSFVNGNMVPLEADSRALEVLVVEMTPMVIVV
jgi:hypothetical protein